jgi:membrane protease YdiL (CAAX protease family)
MDMSIADTVAPLAAYAVVFQSLVYMLISVRLRLRLAPVIVGITGATVALGAGLVFGFDTIGLTGGSPAVAALAGLATIALLSLLGAAALSQASLRRRLADPRFMGMGRAETLIHILVRIPIVTAMTEELFFRGVLHAALIALYPVEAAILLGSVLFGLWHIGPSIDQSRAWSSAKARTGVAVATTFTVIATTVAGLFLVWLRVETGSIWASVAVHAAVNMSVAVLARSASRHPVDAAPDSLPRWKRISEASFFAWRER